MSFDYAEESDGSRYPIPPRAPIEGGPGSNGDLHSLHGVPGSAFEVVDSSRLPRP